VTQGGTGLAALSGLGDPVRRRLYDYVAGCTEPVGRDEAAAETGIGRALAAYHLDKLVELGLLTASYQRLAGRGGPGAGRPSKVYLRSGREFAVTVPPREYELAARLLAQAVESDPGGMCRTALHDAARRFGAELGSRSGGDGGGTGQAGARHAVQSALREHGFEPSRHQDGSIRLRNCPFHRLAAEHPGIVCGMNLALIEGLVAGLGASGLRPALEPRPGTCCVVIGPARRTDVTRRTGSS
jgi:predicted ArsR family transcriptional regulator